MESRGILFFVKVNNFSGQSDKTRLIIMTKEDSGSLESLRAINFVEQKNVFMGKTLRGENERIKSRESKRKIERLRERGREEDM